MSSSFLRSVSSKSQPICVWDLPSRDTNNLLSTVAMRKQTQRKLEEGLTKLSTASPDALFASAATADSASSPSRRGTTHLSDGQAETSRVDKKARKLLFLLHNSHDEGYHRSKSCQTHTDRKHSDRTTSSCCNYGHRHIHTTEIEADAS